MTRECKDDFVALKKYIEEYDISQNLKHSEYIDSLKYIHKCYFSMITWNAEVEHRESEFLAEYNNCTEEIRSRISESVSDMGASFFNWLNGSYKTSRVMLRAAIENYIRAISAIENKAQLTEMNVYSLFENAKRLTIFNSNPTTLQAFSQLHSDYATLCQDIHTTSVKNMEHLSSLAGLPVFKTKKAAESKEIYIRVARNISSIFCLTFNSFFHSMHHRNKENILNALPKNIKPLVANIL